MVTDNAAYAVQLKVIDTLIAQHYAELEKTTNIVERANLMKHIDANLDERLKLQKQKPSNN